VFSIAIQDDQEDLMRRYDFPTAVTFLFAGLGLGAVLAILFAPRPEQRSTEGERIDGERIFDTELRALERDEEPLASRAV
jgi:hypothetical protein